MTDQAAFPDPHELGERSPVESTLDGRLRIVDPEQLDVVGATEADEGVVSAAVLMRPPRKTSKPRALSLDGKVQIGDGDHGVVEARDHISQRTRP